MLPFLYHSSLYPLSTYLKNCIVEMQLRTSLPDFSAKAMSAPKSVFKCSLCAICSSLKSVKKIRISIGNHVANLHRLPLGQTCSIDGRKADYEGNLTQWSQGGIVDVVANADDGTTQHIVLRLGAFGLGLAKDAIADEFDQILNGLTRCAVNFI